MRTLPKVLFLSLVVGGMAPVWAQSGPAAVSAPATREAALARLEQLVSPGPVGGEAEPGKDPFYPPAKDLTDELEKVKAGPSQISPQERLEQIAAQIHPTGSVTLGGEPYLLFTEKRQKIGDKVAVSIDGVEYEVEIISIDKSRFRLRYNNLETTRSIK